MQLDLGAPSAERQFRRVCFNIVARNQDDHVKNIAFLMNKAGEWSLSPAFDLSYSYNPDGTWTSQHQMSMNGKRDNFTIEDFVACGKNPIASCTSIGGSRRGYDCCAQMEAFADEAGVPADKFSAIQKTHRFFSLTTPA